MKFPWGNFTDVMGICSSTFFFGTCAVMGICSSTFFLGTCAVMGTCFSTFFFGSCAVMGTCFSTFLDQKTTLWQDLLTQAPRHMCCDGYLLFYILGPENDQKTTLWQDLLTQAKSRTEEDLLTQAKSRGPTSRVNCFLPMAECAHRVTKNSN